MRTRLTALFLPLAFSLALVVYAQIQTGGKGSASYEKNWDMRITGCLQTGSEPNTYILNNVSMSRSRTGGTPNEMARTETSYKLIPEGNLDLKDHIGHKVEVTGMLKKEEKSSEYSSSSSPSGMSQTPELRVSSIRHISEKCP